MTSLDKKLNCDNRRERVHDFAINEKNVKHTKQSLPPIVKRNSHNIASNASNTKNKETLLLSSSSNTTFTTTEAAQAEGTVVNNRVPCATEKITTARLSETNPIRHIVPQYSYVNKKYTSSNGDDETHIKRNELCKLSVNKKTSISLSSVEKFASSWSSPSLFAQGKHSQRHKQKDHHKSNNNKKVKQIQSTSRERNKSTTLPPLSAQDAETLMFTLHTPFHSNVRPRRKFSTSIAHNEMDSNLIVANSLTSEPNVELSNPNNTNYKRDHMNSVKEISSLLSPHNYNNSNKNNSTYSLREKLLQCHRLSNPEDALSLKSEVPEIEWHFKPAASSSSFLQHEHALLNNGQWANFNNDHSKEFKFFKTNTESEAARHDRILLSLMSPKQRAMKEESARLAAEAAVRKEEQRRKRIRSFLAPVTQCSLPTSQTENKETEKGKILKEGKNKKRKKKRQEGKDFVVSEESPQQELDKKKKTSRRTRRHRTKHSEARERRVTSEKVNNNENNNDNNKEDDTEEQKKAEKRKHHHQYSHHHHKEKPNSHSNKREKQEKSEQQPPPQSEEEEELSKEKLLSKKEKETNDKEEQQQEATDYHLHQLERKRRKYRKEHKHKQMKDDTWKDNTVSADAAHKELEVQAQEQKEINLLMEVITNVDKPSALQITQEQTDDMINIKVEKEQEQQQQEKEPVQSGEEEMSVKIEDVKRVPEEEEKPHSTETSTSELSLSSSSLLSTNSSHTTTTTTYDSGNTSYSKETTDEEEEYEYEEEYEEEEEEEEEEKEEKQETRDIKDEIEEVSYDDETVSEKKERIEIEILCYFHELHKRRSKAALTIQCAWRVHCAKWQLHVRQQVLYSMVYKRQLAAALCIASWYQTHLLKHAYQIQVALLENTFAERAREEQRVLHALHIIERSWVRHVDSFRKRRELCIRLKLSKVDELHVLRRAAIIIQRWWRLIVPVRAYWVERTKQIEAERERNAQQRTRQEAIRIISHVMNIYTIKKNLLNWKQLQQHKRQIFMSRVQVASDVLCHVLREYCLRRDRIAREHIASHAASLQEIQHAWNEALGRRVLVSYVQFMTTISHAATIIQRQWRNYMAGRERRYLRELSYTVQIERINKEFTYYRAVLKVQQFIRFVWFKQHVRQMRATRGKEIIEAIWLLQRVGRGTLHRRILYGTQMQHEASIARATEIALHMEQLKYITINRIANTRVCVLNNLRRQQAHELEIRQLREVVQYELLLDRNAEIIQRAWKRFVARRSKLKADQEHAELLKYIHSCALTMQSAWRQFKSWTSLHSRQREQQIYEEKRLLHEEVLDALYCEELEVQTRMTKEKENKENKKEKKSSGDNSRNRDADKVNNRNCVCTSGVCDETTFMLEKSEGVNQMYLEENNNNDRKSSANRCEIKCQNDLTVKEEHSDPWAILYDIE